MRKTEVITTIVCDRCKTIVREAETVYVSDPTYSTSSQCGHKKLADLCAICMAQFDVFLNHNIEVPA